MFVSVKQSAQWIAQRAEHVHIDQLAVERLADMLKEKMAGNEYDISKWKSDNPLHPQTMDDCTIDWIFLIDSLNFSFWPDEGDAFSIEGQVGYWALCAAIRRTNQARLAEGKLALTDPKVYAHIDYDQALDIFRVDGTKEKIIPMLKERVEIMRQHGSILIEKFDGSFVNVVKKANGSALELLNLIYNNFPSFRDEAKFEGKSVSFLKRAQILVADIWACFEDRGHGHFGDIDQLTIFADYRIPQVLHYFGVLQYSSQLMHRLNTDGGLLRNGERLEIEIRGTSIHALEMVRHLLQRSTKPEDKPPNAIQIDFYLWGYRREHAEDIDQRSPFHKVRCVFY